MSVLSIITIIIYSGSEQPIENPDISGPIHEEHGAVQVQEEDN